MPPHQSLDGAAPREQPRRAAGAPPETALAAAFSYDSRNPAAPQRAGAPPKAASSAALNHAARAKRELPLYTQETDTPPILNRPSDLNSRICLRNRRLIPPPYLYTLSSSLSQRELRPQKQPHPLPASLYHPSIPCSPPPPPPPPPPPESSSR